MSSFTEPTFKNFNFSFETLLPIFRFEGNLKTASHNCEKSIKMRMKFINITYATTQKNINNTSSKPEKPSKLS